MALISLPRIITYDVFKARLILSNAPKIVKMQSASMTSKENRDPTIKKPAPWPYKTKEFTFLKSVYEGTMKRFDENTKFVVVDGSIGAGKSTFAKQLAEAFDFEFFPEPNLEKYYITNEGYDLRKLDPYLPYSCQSCDLKTYYSNPHHQNVTVFQLMMYMFRLQQYIDALAHILNTGQGVVLERCAFGDFVFAETMAKFGYLTQQVINYYGEVTKNTLEELLRPHLIIYLDISPEVALERIKQRNDPAEVNSKVLTKEYLASIDHLYKQKYLKTMNKHAEILVYDWSNYGDVEVVVEDIERIDFDKYTVYDSKMKDWRQKFDWEWNDLRRYYTNDKSKIMGFSYIYKPYIKETVWPAADCKIRDELLMKIPGQYYAEGFNPEVGDKVWFKTKTESYWKSIIYRLGN